MDRDMNRSKWVLIDLYEQATKRVSQASKQSSRLSVIFLVNDSKKYMIQFGPIMAKWR